MSEAEITLSEEQYKILLRVLYFADYCVTTGLNSDFEGADDRDKLYNVLDKIYKQGDAFGYPDSLCLTSLVAGIRFSEDDVLARKRQVEKDLVDIAWMVLSTEFGKRELKGVLLNEEDDPHMHVETYDEINDRWIRESSKKYLREFREKGISNLRFKMFYKVPENEGEE